MSERKTAIETAGNLLNFFREELESAFERLGVEIARETEAYLVHLLDGYTRLDEQRAEELGFDRAAAFMWGDALQASGDRRIDAYRRLGDTCLYNCGFFDERLTRRNIDIDYYQHLGRSAYDNLCDMMDFKQPGGVFSTIYRELSARFDIVVDALRGLRPSSTAKSKDALDALLQRLQRGEDVAPEELARAGIYPGLIGEG
jgi:hypothetical protein